MKDKRKYYLPIIISCISLIVTCIFGYLLLNEKNKFAEFEKKYFSQNGEVTKAQDGKDGINGKDGKDGVDGKNGINGKDGVDGTNGKDGKDGVDGKNGINGKDGLAGKDGTNGKDGKTPELREYNGDIQWKYVEEDNWNTLLSANNSSFIKGLVKYKKSFKTSKSEYVNFSDVTPYTNGDIFASVDGEAIKLNKGHYYYVSLTYTSNGASTSRNAAHIYNGNEKIATAFNYQDATSAQPTNSTSTIFFSNGEDLKVQLSGVTTSYDYYYIDLELTIVDLGE